MLFIHPFLPNLPCNLKNDPSIYSSSYWGIISFILSCLLYPDWSLASSKLTDLNHCDFKLEKEIGGGGGGEICAHFNPYSSQASYKQNYYWDENENSLSTTLRRSLSSAYAVYCMNAEHKD